MRLLEKGMAEFEAYIDSESIRNIMRLEERCWTRWRMMIGRVTLIRSIMRLWS